MWMALILNLPYGVFMGCQMLRISIYRYDILMYMIYTISTVHRTVHTTDRYIQLQKSYYIITK